MRYLISVSGSLLPGHHLVLCLSFSPFLPGFQYLLIAVIAISTFLCIFIPIFLLDRYKNPCLRQMKLIVPIVCIYMCVCVCVYIYIYKLKLQESQKVRTRSLFRDHPRATHHLTGREFKSWKGEISNLAQEVCLKGAPALAYLLSPLQYCRKQRQCFLLSQPGISLESTLGDPEPGASGLAGAAVGPAGAESGVHLLLSTPDLVRPSESNSNHVLNRNLVNQKPDWRDNGEEGTNWQQGRRGNRTPGFWLFHWKRF